MGLNKFRIGRLIKAYKQECGISNLTAAQVSGINAGKEFFEPAKQVGQDTSNYKVVPSGYYACNLMHVGRDMVLPVALNRTTGNKIVSPAYTVFQLVATEMVHPVYLFMLFNSKERDRYFWFHTDGSVRDGMSWDDFCDCEIDVPPIEIQRKYVAIYEAMLTNQRAYEQGLDDLKLAIDALFDNFKKFDTSCLVSNLLYEVNERNSMGLKAKTMGISLDHIFIPSRAEIDNPKKYKLVMPGQIACNLIHVGRDGAMTRFSFRLTTMCLTARVLPSLLTLWDGFRVLKLDVMGGLFVIPIFADA